MAKNSYKNSAPRNLVIVESPAKAKTLEGFLGSDFLVKSSYGHVRNLNLSNLFDDTLNVQPPAIKFLTINPIVEELRRLSSKAEVVWLASDNDREGEAISWHIFDELKLPMEKTKRIVFNEITQPAILKAIETPRQLDTNLVDAQQARRVLDRLVGYELSPVLWKKVKPSLSAGRVQSVAVRLLVEREREIQNFKTESSFRVVALLEVEQGGKRHIIKAILPKKLATRAKAEAFLQTCQNARFSIGSIEKKNAKRTPAAPFTTSTLLQEASRKLGYSVSQTMVLAQKLYEAGKITYMRTDSVNLSKTALDATKAQIDSKFGPRYHKQRKFANKSKGAQEAHEAIRPTYMENLSAGGDNQEKKLYELIWKRTITSQMADAELEKTVIKINISGTPEQLEAQGEVIVFDGFLRVYSESKDDGDINIDENEDSGLLPAVETGQPAALQELTATQKFASSPPRYTEASLVKKLEDLGIGRPSTYAPTISTIQKRNYVIKEDRDGTQRMYDVLTLNNHQIRDEIKSEITGDDKNKLFPTDIGSLANDFLTEHFDQFLNYEFTAKVEMDFDEIAAGNKNWLSVVDATYKPLHAAINQTLEDPEKATGSRLLGTEPKDGKNVYVRIGRYGPLAQIGENEDEDKKFANLRKGMRLETITLEEALDLFKIPRSVGAFEEKEMVIGIGRLGPYIHHNSAFYSLGKEDDPITVTSDRAVEIIQNKREADAKKVISKFDTDPIISVLNGRFGPYITKGKDNYKIPKDRDPQTLTLEDCEKIIESAGTAKPTRKP